MKIAFINQSTLVPASDFTLMVKACAAQALFDLMPLWNEATVMVDEAATDDSTADSVPIILFDDSDVAGAMGYHDKTPDGRPYGRVFVHETTGSGGSLWQTPDSVSVTMSHEMCETIVDPNINLWGEEMGVLYALEACDAVEGDAYKVDLSDGSVFVSNFITPAWFDVNSNVSVYDKMNLLFEPFTLRPGGYTLLLQGGSIQQKYASNHIKRASKSHPAARTAKRIRRFQA